MVHKPVRMLHDCAASSRKATDVGVVILHGCAEPASATGTALVAQANLHRDIESILCVGTIEKVIIG